MTPEERARQQIDAMLIASGWLIQDYKALNLGASRGIALHEVPLKSGRCDYLLLVDRTPVGVVEAKKEGTTLSTVADQSGHYAENLPDILADLTPSKLRFLYESTGAETFFRDEQDPESRSRQVFSFHRRETIFPPYLAYYLCASEGGWSQFKKLQRGATKTGFGLDGIRNVQVPVPPLAEQHRIVAEVERRLSVIAELESMVTTNLRRANHLRQSILHRAFVGEL